jgi:hygromycin-B 4-O-kinase
MVVDPDAVTVVRAAAFLAERFGDGVADVGHLGTGEWSKAFAFRQAGDEWVIRFGALREDFDKDQRATRFNGPGLPVPRVPEVGAAETVGQVGREIGGYYAISQRLHGTYIDHADAEQMRALLPSLFGALDAMRLADISDTAGYGIWDGDGAAPYSSWPAYLLDVEADHPSLRTHGWRERLAGSPTGSGLFNEAFRTLRSLAAALPEDRHLIHSDLLHFNVLVAGDKITGVLDWGCGMYGDFLYDLAWVCFWAPWSPAWDGIDFEAEALRHYEQIGLTVPAFKERLRACQIHIGLGGQAYQAFTGRWDDVAATARRTLEIARLT